MLEIEDLPAAGDGVPRKKEFRFGNAEENRKVILVRENLREGFKSFNYFVGGVLARGIKIVILMCDIWDNTL